jgi:outer membrane protein TolC
LERHEDNYEDYTGFNAKKYGLNREQNMKTTSNIIVFFVLAIFWILGTEAQNNDSNEYKSDAVKLLIPGLSVLIDSALVHNGMVSYRRLEIEAKRSNLKSKQRNWTRNFGIQADTRYGTFDNFSSNVSGPNTTTLASTTKQLNYGIGLYLKIPVFDVLHRKSDIKQAKAELEQAESLARSQEDELRELVIRYYEDLILKQNLLEIRASNLGNARVNMEMVEKEFRNGLIAITEYVRVSDMTSRIASEYQEAKSELLVSKKLLENITGIELY